MPYHIYAYDSYGSTTEGGGSYEGQLLASYKGYDRGPFGYKTGVRQYDPETGRFLSPDPFKGYMTDPASQHPYMYCRGNPVRYSDPSGYSPDEEYMKLGIYDKNKRQVGMMLIKYRKGIRQGVAIVRTEKIAYRLKPVSGVMNGLDVYIGLEIVRKLKTKTSKKVIKFNIRLEFGGERVIDFLNNPNIPYGLEFREKTGGNTFYYRYLIKEAFPGAKANAKKEYTEIKPK